MSAEKVLQVKNGLRVMLEQARHLEAGIWRKIDGQGSQRVDLELKDLKNLVGEGLFEISSIEKEIKLIEEEEKAIKNTAKFHNVTLERSADAKALEDEFKSLKQIVEELNALESLISKQISDLEKLTKRDSTEITWILDGYKHDNSFSKTSQAIHSLIEKLGADEKNLAVVSDIENYESVRCDNGKTIYVSLHRAKNSAKQTQNQWKKDFTGSKERMILAKDIYQIAKHENTKLIALLHGDFSDHWLMTGTNSGNFSYNDEIVEEKHLSYLQSVFETKDGLNEIKTNLKKMIGGNTPIMIYARSGGALAFYFGSGEFLIRGDVGPGDSSGFLRGVRA